MSNDARAPPSGKSVLKSWKAKLTSRSDQKRQPHEVVESSAQQVSQDRKPTENATKVTVTSGGAEPRQDQPAAVASLWERADNVLRSRNPAMHSQLQHMRTSDSELSIENLTQRVQEERERLEAEQRRMEVGKRRLLIRACRYMQAMRGALAAPARFDPSGATTVVVPAVLAVIDIAVAKLDVDHNIYIGLTDVSSKLRQWGDRADKVLRFKHAPNSTAYQQAEEDLVSVYVCILEYIAMIHDYFKASMAKTPYRKMDLEKKKAEIDAKHKACEVSFDKIKTDSDFLEVNRKVLNWITEDNPVDIHLKLRNKSKVDNMYAWCGEWLLQCEDYSQWETHSGLQVFWLCGTAGTGKSTVSCRLVEELRRHSAGLHDTSVAYVYCSNTDRSNITTAKSALDLILQQVSEIKGHIAVVNALATFYSRHFSERSKGARLSEAEQLEILQAIFASGRETRVIIDALDECNEWQKLLKALQSAAASHTGDLKLFITSREDVDVQAYFPHSTKKMLIAELSSDDMEQFVSQEIFSREDRLLQGKYPNLEARLVKALLKQARGMFQWVKLTLTLFFGESPLSPVDWEEVEQQIADIETSHAKADDMLREVYRDILRRNAPGKKSKAIAQRAFKMLLGAMEILDLAELTEALAVNEPTANDYCNNDIDFNLSQNHVRNVLRNLVTFTTDEHGTNMIEFTHMSVVDFLLFEYEQITQLQCHQTLLDVCLFSIRLRANDDESVLSDGETLEKILKLQQAARPEVWYTSSSKSFMSYADRYWADHCAAVLILSGQDDGAVDYFTNEILGGDAWTFTFNAWLRQYREPPAQKYWRSFLRVQKNDEAGCAQEDEGSHGRDDYSMTSKVSDGTRKPTENDELEVPNTQIMGDEVDKADAWETPEQHLDSSSEGRYNFGDSRDWERWERWERHHLLFYATHNMVGWWLSVLYGIPKLASGLTSHPRGNATDIVESRGVSGYTTLSCIHELRAGLEGVLRRAINPDSALNQSLKASHHPEMLMDLILSLGANPNTMMASFKRTCSGMERMFISCSERRVSEESVCGMLEVLIRYKFDIDTCTTRGINALSFAVTYRREKVAQLLLQRGAKQDSDLFDLAACCGYIQIMQLLLEYRTSSERSEATRHVWDYVTSTIYTPELAEYVLSLGQSVHCCGKKRRMPRILSGEWPWACLLIEQGADLAYFDGNYERLLNDSLGALTSDIESVTFLFILWMSRNPGSDRYFPKHYQETAPDNLWRMWEAQPAMIQVLIRLGVFHPTAQDETGRTIFQWLISLGSWATSINTSFDILLRAGGDINQADMYGVTPLMVASKYDSKLFYQILKVAKPFKDSQGREVLTFPDDGGASLMPYMDAEGNHIDPKHIVFEIKPASRFRSHKRGRPLSSRELDDLIEAGTKWAAKINAEQGWTASDAQTVESVYLSNHPALSEGQLLAERA